jgi:D-amino-acid dehydrogenase
LRFRFGIDWQRYAWALAFLRECLPTRHRHNTERIAQLALRSGRALRALREQTGIDYDHCSRGILHLLRDRASFDAAGARIDRLRTWGIRATLLSPSECRTLEPALDHPPGLLGAIHAPDDESGDAHRFTRRLAELFVGQGGTLRTGEKVTALERERGRILRVRTMTADGGSDELGADAFVVCLGSDSARLVAPLGLRLPIYPVKGYSVTVPVLAPERVTRISLTDESRRLVCSRLGDRLRLAGTAEIAGYDKSVEPRRVAALCDWIDTFFPGATDLSAARGWAGLRPCTPGYVPLIGTTAIDGLWLNTGHGSLGWTLACGSAEWLSECLTSGSRSVRHACMS